MKTEPELYYYPEQIVKIKRFNNSGFILDIGGGGEGIIGQLNPGVVVAIDIDKSELAEAAGAALKIVMDGRDLGFLNNSFTVVTSLYSLLYMNNTDQGRVFGEVFRVLVPGGIFHIWDAAISRVPDIKYRGFVVPVKFDIQDKIIHTGFGAEWPAVDYSSGHYLSLAEKTGFKPLIQLENKGALHFQLQKPF